MKLKKGVLLILFIISWDISRAQENPDPRKDNTIEQKIEAIAEGAEETELDYTNLLDELLHFQNNPLNLNQTTRDQLDELGLLSEFQVTNLFNHIEKNGKLMTLYELQTIEGFDLVTIMRILPFIKVNKDFDSPNLSWSEIMKNGQNELFLRYQRILEKQEGFSEIDPAKLSERPNSRYLGSPERLYARYRFKFSNNISLGLTGEKDQGEEFFKGSQEQGFDFYSGHFFLKNIGKLKALAIGDYQAQFGQGLTFSSGLAMGKSAYVLNIKRLSQGLKPYTSVDENRFQRGVATTLAFKKIEVTGFYSYKMVDANISIEDSSLTDEILQASLDFTGFHSTPSELADKDAIKEQIIGTNLQYKDRNLQVGLTALQLNFSEQLLKKTTIYNQFDFKSGVSQNIGLDYSYLFRNFSFFGEAARSGNGGYAFLNGVLISIDPKLVVSFLQRNYQRNYQALYSNAFAENTFPKNEQGFYTGIQFKPLTKFTVSAYYDRFSFPWLKTSINGSSQGSDYMIQVNFTPSKKTDMYFRFRERSKQKNSGFEEDEIDYLAYIDQRNYRFDISYTITESIRLKNRVEVSSYQLPFAKSQQGYLLYQDIIYKGKNSPVSFSLRYALFDVDTYNARIYMYENDVLYGYSIPALYNRGSRGYITLKYNISRGIDCWLRYAQTFYSNINTIGSGLTTIDGNTKSEVKFQVRFKF